MPKSYLQSVKFEFFLLTLIVLISFIFHFYNLSYPAKPVFDEAHFATYAAAISSGRAHFDIHPPLAKTIYAAVLKFFPEETYRDKIFIEIARNPKTGKIENKHSAQSSYNDFPYLALRGTSAIFGLLMIIAAYFFLKAIAGRTIPSLLFTAFIAFENSLLLETRLILLNGIYLAFGLFALFLYFKQKPMPLTAGVFWGFALSVKLIALGFLGAIIADLVLSKKEERNSLAKKAMKFIIIGLTTFFIIFVLFNNLLVPVSGRLVLYKTLLPDIPILGQNSNVLHYLQATLVELNLMLSGYTSSVGPHPAGSNWYEWPIMKRPITYFPYFEQIKNNDSALVLIGNPFLWALSTLAVIWAVLDIIKNGSEKIREKRILVVLLGGYIFSLLPFVLFVRRVTFLYHYFPALLFALSMLAVLLWEKLERFSPQQRKIIFSFFLVLAITGFLLAAPYTSGMQFWNPPFEI